jgi:hypothetical protein
MRLLLVLFILLSIKSHAAAQYEYQGIYEGLELFRNEEVNGTSYLYVDLLTPNGSFVYKADIASDEDGMECLIVTTKIDWNPPVAKIPLVECKSNPFKFEYELLLVLDAAILIGSTNSLNSEALVTLIIKNNEVATEATSMWLRRTEKKSLLEQLKNVAPYN